MDELSNEEVLLKLFKKRHGYLENTELVYDEDDYLIGIGYFKNGSMCWMDSATDLMLWYIGQKL